MNRSFIDTKFLSLFVIQTFSTQSEFRKESNRRRTRINKSGHQLKFDLSGWRLFKQIPLPRKDQTLFLRYLTAARILPILLASRTPPPTRTRPPVCRHVDSELMGEGERKREKSRRKFKAQKEKKMHNLQHVLAWPLLLLPLLLPLLLLLLPTARKIVKARDSSFLEFLKMYIIFLCTSVLWTLMWKGENWPNYISTELTWFCQISPFEICSNCKIVIVQFDD